MIHHAGPLIDGLQRCTRCGEILSDFRNAMVPDGMAEYPLRGWAEDASVEVSGEVGQPRFSTITDAAPDCELRQ